MEELENNETKVETLFMVLKLQKKVEYTSPLTGQKMEVSIDGIEGFICVYKTLEQAEFYSNDGKYQVIPIKTF